MNRLAIRRMGAAALVILVLSGCSTAYYKTMEAFGQEKRDLLRSNVAAAREEQAEAQQEFKDALTQLKELTQFEGGELEDTYNELKEQYEDCEDRAEAVRDRIDKVERIAEDLFTEWEKEIEQISNAKMKQDSAKKRRATQQRYAGLQSALRSSEKSMDTVLVRFRDNVLYLKHNLNAQAVGALDTEVMSIEKDVAALIKDMEASIAKADDFIATLPE